MERYKIKFTRNIAPLLLAGAFTYTLGSFMLSANAETNEPKKDNKCSVESVNPLENVISNKIKDPTFVKRACLFSYGQWKETEVEGVYSMRTAGYKFKPVFDSMTDDEILKVVNKILEDKDYDNSPYLEIAYENIITNVEKTDEQSKKTEVTNPAFVKTATLVSHGEWEVTAVEGLFRQKNIGYGFIPMDAYSDDEILKIVNKILGDNDYDNSPYLVKLSEFYYYSEDASLVKTSEESFQLNK